MFFWTLYAVSSCHSDSAIFYKTRVKLFDPNMGQKYPGQSWCTIYCSLEWTRFAEQRKMIAVRVSNCFVEPALHRWERELWDKNHRLWLCSPETTRQSAPEDSLLHPAVCCTRDTQIWWLWWVLRPVESRGHSGEWKSRAQVKWKRY